VVLELRRCPDHGGVHPHTCSHPGYTDCKRIGRSGGHCGSAVVRHRKGMASHKQKGKPRAPRHTDGAAHNHLPFYLHEELTDALAQLGGSESLGRWPDFITPDQF
jgi:hypothetical protein